MFSKFILIAERKESMKTTYCQAFCQLSSIPSSQLCVRLASGGDPTFSFNVRLIGEEVHGTSMLFYFFIIPICIHFVVFFLPVFITQKILNDSSIS